MFAAGTGSFVPCTPVLAAAGPARVICFATATLQRERARQPTICREVANAPLASLGVVGLAGAFHGWRGKSGRRYTFAVTPAADCDHLALDYAVVIVAQIDEERRRALYVGLGAEIAAARFHAQAGTELHYHLLATTPAARDAVIGDLLGHN